MKPIKIFGLVALAALMAMAFVGVNSAAAAESTALCGLFESPCENSIVTHVHETSVGKGKLLTSSGTIECDVLFLGDAESGLVLEGPVTIKGTFTYSTCTSGCTVTEENGPSVLKVQREGTEQGSVVGVGLVHSACSFLNCRYVGTGLKGTAKGPKLSTQPNGEVTLKEQTTTKESGTFCPTTSKLDLTTTPLSATYLSS